MAEPFLVFLPFARRGAAAAVTAPPDDLDGNPLPSHPEFTVELHLASEVSPGVEIGHRQRVLDSGSVAGIDPTVVIRTDPAADATDFLPANMASVEIGVPDLPWMFTPAAPTGRPPKLRPWLALAVVDLAAEADWQPSARPLPRLSVRIDALPDHRDLWAWAHVQCSLHGDPAAPVDEATLREAPALARLVCPRHLEPGTTYLACVVPTFEAGRRAGLEDDVPDGASIRTRPAWRSGSGETVELPVYYSWQFTTAPPGAAADFEELASRLRPATPEECSQLQPAPVDVTNPLGLEPAALTPQTLRLTTALRFAGDLDDDSTELGGWDPEVRHAFRDRLHVLLDVPADEVDPVVTPPIYGGYHARVDRVGPPPWIEQLNLDARFRIAGGLGAQYVREEQERLMQRAWEQLDALDARNHLQRVTELALIVGERQHGRHVAALSDEQRARFAAPAAKRLPVDLPDAGVRTLAGAVCETSLPDAAFTPALARLLRPRATVARRFARGTGGLTVLVNGLRNAVAAPVVDAAVTPTVQLVPAQLPAAQQLPPPDTMTFAAAQAEGHIASIVASMAGQPPSPADLVEPQPQPLRRFADRPGTEAPLTETLLDGIDPAAAALGRLAARVASGGQDGEPGQVPEFPAPMAAALTDSHPDWLLPGLTSVPEDRVALLETNPRWVEAFLVGLNHELNRELLWRAYRADLGVSAFTRFWPRHDQTADIEPISSWTDARPLGAHRPASTGAVSQIVLLVRAALLRRFPAVTLYARPAVAVERDGFRFHDERLDRDPIPHSFALRLGDDTVAFGFSLAEAAALGQDPDGDGVVFVFEQPPHQPQFGLDAEPTSDSEAPFWDNVAWQHVEGPRGPSGARFADARRDLRHEPVRWGLGSDAAGFAYATFQRPVKMVFHAADLLLAPRPIDDPHRTTVERIVSRTREAFGPHALRSRL